MSPFPAGRINLFHLPTTASLGKSVLSVEASLWKPSNLGSHPNIAPRVTVKEKEMMTNPAGPVEAKELSWFSGPKSVVPGVEELASQNQAGL